MKRKQKVILIISLSPHHYFPFLLNHPHAIGGDDGCFVFHLAWQAWALHRFASLLTFIEADVQVQEVLQGVCSSHSIGFADGFVETCLYLRDGILGRVVHKAIELAKGVVVFLHHLVSFVAEGFGLLCHFLYLLYGRVSAATFKL